MSHTSLYRRVLGTGDPTQVVAQYVWGVRPGHRDELILRDRDTTGDGALDERLYCLMDYFNPVAVVDAAAVVKERYAWSAFGLRRVMGPDWAERVDSLFEWDFGFHGQFLDGETGYYDYGFRFYSPDLGRWISRDPIGENGGINQYAFVENNAIRFNDLLGLIRTHTVSFTGKSFINGVGSDLGDLSGRFGLVITPSTTIPINIPTGISASGEFANQRLAAYALLVGGIKAFNENPSTDSKNGEYRLFSRINATVCCENSEIAYFSFVTDKEGGNELPGIYGSINMETTSVDGRKSASIQWETWGKPNLVVEPGMQWVAFRSSVNIWHKSFVTLSCAGDQVEYEVQEFDGSKFPSHRLWVNGALEKFIAQGTISNLWHADPNRATFVA